MGENNLGGVVNGYFNSSKGDIRYIFAPFIQRNALEEVLPSSDADTIIVTRWRLADLASGVSDPDVFNYVRDQGYTLKIHHRLHAKLYSWDLDSALIGSANLTKVGMGIAEESNVEILQGPFQLPIQTQLKLRKAEKEAKLVTEDDYQRAVDVVEDMEYDELDYSNLDLGNDPEYLVSQLPMTEDPNLLIEVLSKGDLNSLRNLDPIQRRCVLHDISTFSLEDFQGKPELEVRVGLRNRFENHNFIRMIIDHMDPCIYFGEMKEIVQEECEDVPTPSRKELTSNVQILYEWFAGISPERFEHDVPGTHSERLCDTR